MKTLSVEDLYRTLSPSYFEALSTFGALSEKVVKQLLTEGSLFELDAGEALYNTGDMVEEFFVVLTGNIELFHFHRDQPSLTHCYGPGQQIGFVGMIALHERKGTAIAKQKSTIVSISIQQFSELRESMPDVFGLLMLNLAREMARTIGELGDLIAELGAK